MTFTSIKKFLNDTVKILLITFGVFVVVNIGAWFYLQNSAENTQQWQGRWFVNPNSARGKEIRKQALGTQDVALLNSLETSPPLREHTILPFANSTSNDAYTIGLEGIRYQDGWTDDFIQEALNSGEAVFVFGGSTTFGHGVGNDQTIVSYLNEADPGHTYLNFGTNAYDSLREVDKLVYLLRKGYRPKKVIFIDGLNDITTFSSTPHEAHDKPRTQGFLIRRGSLALIFGNAVPNNMLLAAAYSLPVTHLYFRLLDPSGPLPYGSVNSNRDPVDYRSLSWHYENQFEYGNTNREAIIADWLRYYPQNIQFVTGLAKAFGFEAEFFFQPFGVVETDNPFLNPAYMQSEGIILARDFTAAAENAINTGKLKMFDCQSAFADIDRSKAFVDATHYSPSGNKSVAGCILGQTTGL